MGGRKAGIGCQGSGVRSQESGFKGSRIRVKNIKKRFPSVPSVVGSQVSGDGEDFGFWISDFGFLKII
jgi:hypothetical protein